jgi:predicted nucleic acid-binding protein
LTAADAQKIIEAFRKLQLDFIPTALLLDEAFRLAIAHQRTVYDAMYLALSVREGCRLLTADEKLVHALVSKFPDLVWVGSWP